MFVGVDFDHLWVCIVGVDIGSYISLHRRRSTLKLGGLKIFYEGRRLFSIEGGL